METTTIKIIFFIFQSRPRFAHFATLSACSATQLCLARGMKIPPFFLTYNNSKDSTRYSCKNSSERQKKLSFEIFREFFFSIFFISAKKNRL